jgi:hypothetical protein
LLGNQAFQHYFSLSSICLPSSVEKLGYRCFDDCRSLSSITFEPNCELWCIECDAFGNCSSLSSICLPRKLRKLDLPAFTGSNLGEIEIEEGNCDLKLDGSFLVDFDNISIKYYFGDASEVRIGRRIRNLEIGCFSGRRNILRVIFESCSKSRVLRIIYLRTVPRFRRFVSLLQSKFLVQIVSLDVNLFQQSHLKVVRNSLVFKIMHFESARRFRRSVSLLWSKGLVEIVSRDVSLFQQ